MSSRNSSESRSPQYQLFMLVLCLYTLGALTTDSFLVLDPPTRTILEYADNVVCVVLCGLSD